MPRFRTKPVVIEAYRLPALDEDAMVFARAVAVGQSLEQVVVTREGMITAQPGDWIIKGVNGEFFLCRPDIFEATYEPAD